MNSESTENVDAASDEQLQRRIEGYSRLLDVTRALAAKIDVNEILATIITESCQALDCDRASLFRYDSKADELFTSVVTELEISEIRKPLDSGITGYVARTRAIANVPEPSQDARWNAEVDRATGYQTRNILAAPLSSSHDGSLLGVLQVLNKHEGSFDNIDEELIEAFSQHAAIALDRAQLVQRLQERQKIETSLNVAREVQRGFMPSDLPTMPGYESATWWFPHEAIGGDYCDVLPLRDGRTAFCVADVSGHGLGPALIMASVRAALKALLLEHLGVQILLERLGLAMADDLQTGTFITMVLAIVDHESHSVQFSNAGHAPALHYSAREDRFASMDSTGVPLGVLDEPDYPPGDPITMEVGDMILLCTDGIVEAMDRDDKQFGQERLEQLVRQNHASPVERIVETVGAAVEGHYAGDSPPDDLTILAFRRNG